MFRATPLSSDYSGTDEPPLVHLFTALRELDANPVTPGRYGLRGPQRARDYHRLVKWWDRTKASVRAEELDLGECLRAYAKGRSRLHRVPQLQKQCALRAVLCCTVLLSLLFLSAFVSVRAFTYDQGMEIYAIQDPGDPQYMCICDTKCQCVCQVQTLLSSDLGTMVECQTQFVATLNQTGAALVASSDALLANASCGAFVAAFAQSCATTFAFVAARYNITGADPASHVDWVALTILTLACEAPSVGSSSILNASACSSDGGRTLSSLLGAGSAGNATADLAALPIRELCGLICLTVSYYVPRGEWGKYEGCESSQAYPVKAQPWNFVDGLWLYYYQRTLAFSLANATDSQFFFEDDLQPIASSAAAVAQDVRLFNACPAKSNRLVYLSAVWGIVLILLSLWIGGALLAYKVIQGRTLPLWGHTHFAFITAWGGVLIPAAIDVMADWSTWCIDIAKRRYSASVFYWAYLAVTCCNTAVHLVRVAVTWWVVAYDPGPNTAMLSVEEAHEEGRFQTGLLALLLSCDITQGFLLLRLVWYEEIEESGTMYLLIIWNAMTIIETVRPLLVNFVIKGWRGVVPAQWWGAPTTERREYPLSPDARPPLALSPRPPAPLGLCSPTLAQGRPPDWDALSPPPPPNSAKPTGASFCPADLPSPDLWVGGVPMDRPGQSLPWPESPLRGTGPQPDLPAWPDSSKARFRF